MSTQFNRSQSLGGFGGNQQFAQTGFGGQGFGQGGQGGNGRRTQSGNGRKNQQQQLGGFMSQQGGFGGQQGFGQQGGQRRRTNQGQGQAFGGLRGGSYNPAPAGPFNPRGTRSLAQIQATRNLIAFNEGNDFQAAKCGRALAGRQNPLAIQRQGLNDQLCRQFNNYNSYAQFGPNRSIQEALSGQNYYGQGNFPKTAAQAVRRYRPRNQNQNQSNRNRNNQQFQPQFQQQQQFPMQYGQ
jgi:hypothetical protein